jgi:hypothetical protein
MRECHRAESFSISTQELSRTSGVDAKFPGESSDMPSSADLRQHAAHCLRIAAAVDDQKIAATLVAMADDFSVKADEIDPSLGSNGETAIDSGKAGSTSR